MVAPLRGSDTGRAVVALRYVVLALVLLAAFAFLPLGAPLVLGVWTAILCRPLSERLGRKLKHEKRAAMLTTVLVIVLILVPAAVLAVSLSLAAVDLAAALKHSKQASDIAHSLLPASEGPSLAHLSPARVMDFARRHGAEAAKAASATFGALTAAAVGLVIYVYALYASLVDGKRAYAWFRERSFIPRDAFTRLCDAFAETGRGLLIAIAGTALIQGVVATIGYAVVGVPLPLLLGFVTTLAALIPSVGTALVWVPVTLLLFATDRTAAAVVLGVIGCITSVVDNFVRPWLSKFGELKMPTFVTFVAMLGGIVAFGGFGLVLGPLFARLALEALDIWKGPAPATS